MNATTVPSETPQNPLLAFPGFPYLVTRIKPSLYHVHLLPLDERYGLHRLQAIAHRQVDANRLRACLVLGETQSLFLEPAGDEKPSAQIPFNGYLEHGKLVLCEPLPETEDLVMRGKLLERFAQSPRSAEDHLYILGDLTKGGRYPNEAEKRRLHGRQEDGVPLGLTRCPECGDWRGECFDTHNEELVVTVCCLCGNDTRCAGCGRAFGERRLDANFYSETDGGIWHVPAFAALTHRCPDPDIRGACQSHGDKSHGTKSPARKGHIVIHKCSLSMLDYRRLKLSLCRTCRRL